MSRRFVETSLRCSFCHKSEKSVGKLISSPSDYPRAYICDECIAVCQAIIEDDAGVPNALDLDEILRRPQMVELIGALNCWVDRETRGENAEEELGEVRRLTMQILPYRAADSDK